MGGKKWFKSFIVLGVVIALLCGCAKKSAEYESKNEVSYDSTASDYGTVESVVGEEAATSAVAEEPLKNTSYTNVEKPANNLQEKIIIRASLDVETMEFDNLIGTIDTEVNQLGGYIESSNISGRYYYSDNLRNGNIVARIPKDKLDQFIGKVYDISNVVNKQLSSENVTLEYVDTESHKKALEIEQERLLTLLEKVEKLEDMLTLESRLSSVRYELESYESQLRLYDNLVDYSTVTLNIQEVERMTVVEEKKPTVLERIQTGLGTSMYDIGEGLKNFFVGFVVNLPYIVIWVFLIGVSILIGRKIYKKNKVKNEKKKQEPMLGLQNDQQEENDANEVDSNKNQE